jgi:hypothetical protein
MKQSKIVLTLAVLLAVVSTAGIATAQVAMPTATRTLTLSAFGGVSGVYTGLAGGKNLSIVAGADLGLGSWRGVRPEIEVRGAYPVDKGTIDSQKSVLGGLKVDFLLNHRLRPYGDVLFGRGEMDYQSGYLFNNLVYQLTTTNVYSAGGGVDYDLNDNFAIKADAQIQRWGYAPTPSGNLYSKLGTVGVIYRFNFGTRRRR